MELFILVDMLGSLEREFETKKASHRIQSFLYIIFFSPSCYDEFASFSRFSEGVCFLFNFAEVCFILLVCG